MKRLLFMVFISICSMNVFAENVNSEKIKTENIAPAKVLDITIIVGGYTIHIFGTATYGINGIVTIKATMTITGGGISLDLPFNYTGPLNANRGTYNNTYSDKAITTEDKPMVSYIMEHVYLPAEVNPRKAKVVY